MFDRFKYSLIYFFVLSTNTYAHQATAQIIPIPDRSLGCENSQIKKERSLNLIEGGAIRGANLFHSFDKFNVGNRQSVYFANPQGIENIFSRVTGNNLSKISGTLGVDGGTNLLLLSPNGIVFGEEQT